MQVSLWSSFGEQVGQLEISEHLFGAPMNRALVHQVAISHMANRRQGNAATKTRGMVSGGGAKPWRQKHTGRARQGSIRSPQWRGGGVVFGPHPRDYSRRIPKKMNRGAIRCVLSEKTRSDKLLVLDELHCEKSKTKEFLKILSRLSVNTSALVVTKEPASDVIRAARNITKIKTTPAPQLNVLDLLNHDRVIMTVDAVRRIEDMWDIGKAKIITETLPESGGE